MRLAFRMLLLQSEVLESAKCVLLYTHSFCLKGGRREGTRKEKIGALER
jgi:hypothetical protein